MSIFSQKLWRWGLLAILSVVITAALLWLHVSAALLLGPMLAGIILGVSGASLSVPRPCFSLAQSVLGCFIASSLSLQVLQDLASFWYLALALTLSTLVISVLCGKFLARFSALPGNTAIWGILPGGASAMVVVCSDYGADMRLVAFIQYLRVVIVVLSMAAISHFYMVDRVSSVAVEIVWFPPLTSDFFITLAIAIVGCILSRYIKIPSGRLLIPMVICVVVQLQGWVQIEVSEWLLALSFAMVGLSAGLRFNISVLKLALKALPITLVSIFAIMIFCYFQALFMSSVMDVDFLTAFLATSPGGLESSVIIAVETNSSLSIVVPLQILRLFSVLLFGPFIARYMSRNILSNNQASV
ncbi:AbrB family transcriptional regulator [Zophobihabitans entericus]|uniref:AbrB family transcriptional regulator n=1 Tax=Zophobihabitans entericus TaxID=1635327 RepID=A0A6G9I9Z4_9GAMM|nr:AbrB family transcriptional regulator [Zophobihabitans entericus]QIQ21055.1 AbrB family transcriptional regulator [Zophobihabitans entericus]